MTTRGAVAIPNIAAAAGGGTADEADGFALADRLDANGAAERVEPRTCRRDPAQRKHGIPKEEIPQEAGAPAGVGDVQSIGRRRRGGDDPLSTRELGPHRFERKKR